MNYESLRAMSNVLIYINTLKQCSNYVEELASLKQFYLRRAQFTIHYFDE